MTAYDSPAYMCLARHEAKLCALCLFDDGCHPESAGCQLRAERALEVLDAKGVGYVWRGMIHSSVAQLAEASGAGYDRLLYRLRRGHSVDDAVRLAGGNEK